MKWTRMCQRRWHWASRLWDKQQRAKPAQVRHIGQRVSKPVWLEVGIQGAGAPAAAHTYHRSLCTADNEYRGGISTEEKKKGGEARHCSYDKR